MQFCAFEVSEELQHPQIAQVNKSHVYTVLNLI